MDKTQEAAHTPGPWKATVGACYEQVEVEGGPLICFAAIREESKANARLIAQSPMFLAWAQRQLERKHRGQVFLDNEDVLELEQIVAKATGAAAPAAPSLALTAFIQDVEAAEGKATGSAA